jgi:CRP-like cAMP-binding protein
MGPGAAGRASAGYEPLSAAQFDLLRQVAFVRLLPDTVRVLVCHLFAPVTLAAGQLLIEEGTAADALYVVSAGELEVVKAQGATEVALDRVPVGRVVGEVALLEDLHRTATVRAARSGPAQVLRLDRHSVGAVLEVHPEVRATLALGVRWSRVNALLRGHPAFATLPVPLLVEVLDAFVPVALSAGEVLDDAGDGLYALETGRLLLRAADGADVADVGELGPGDLFGEGTAVEEDGVRPRIRALEDSRLFCLRRDAFPAHLARNEQFARALRERSDARTRGEGPATSAVTRTARRLKIEIDQARRDRAVAEITESDFFAALQVRAQELRRQVRVSPVGSTASG